MGIFKLMFSFVLSIFLVNKEEANIHSYKFNPSKMLLIFVLIMSIFLNVLFITKANKVLDKVKAVCPNFFI